MGASRDLVESLSGESYLAIQAAVTHFLSRYPSADLAQYRINVYREGKLLHVSFLDKERPPTMLGSGGRPGCPGFEVTLGSADLSLVEAYFVR